MNCTNRTHFPRFSWLNCISRFAVILASALLLSAWVPVKKLENPVILASAGIPVSNLATAQSFYQNVFGLQALAAESDQNVRLGASNRKGSDLVLCQKVESTTSGYAQNPGKIVFYSSALSSVVPKIVQNGGVILLPPTPQPAFGGALIGFARDLDGNLLELVGVPSAAGTYLSAFGVGVSDLEASKTFYTEHAGFSVQQFLSIPGQYDEYILQSDVPGSSALVLMHWTNGSSRNYQNTGIQLELSSANPATLALALAQGEVTMVRLPAPIISNGKRPGGSAGYAKDADGNLLQLTASNKGYLAAAGIVVPDLDAAVAFYRDGLGMTEVSRTDHDDRSETRMMSADARGSEVVLIQSHTDTPPDYARNPGKLVFYVRDPQAFMIRLAAAGGQILLPPTPQPSLGNVVVGFARDLNRNLIEFVGVPTATDSYFAAFGIGVSDLESAKTFYTEVLGFEVGQFLRTPSYDEYILQGEGGSALVLMHWTNGSERNYSEQPASLELRTISPWKITADAFRAGARILKLPSLFRENGVLTGRITDTDNTVINVLLAPWGQTDE